MNLRLGTGMLLVLAAGCGQGAHLQYDYGRAYTQAFTAQPDLTRPSVSDSLYPLYGLEGTKIRLLVEEATTQEESGQSVLSTGAN